MKSPPLDDFLHNLATSLTETLFETGANRARLAALGAEEARIVRAGYVAGFQALLATAGAGLPDEQRPLLDEIFHNFVAQPQVAGALAAMALAGAPPDLAALAAQFESLAFDRSELAIDFYQALVAFQGGLAETVVAEARRPGAPPFTHVSLGRVLTLQTLLHDPVRQLDEISERLRRLESQGGQTVYNIIVEQATGLAIGDQATVHQTLPADVQSLLAQTLDLLRRLSTRAEAPAFTAADLRLYLDNLIELCSSVDLRGTGGPEEIERLPLERIYVALQADPSNAAERSANRQQLLADVEEALALGEFDERAKQQVWRQIVAGRDPIGLTLALRNRQAGDVDDYLAHRAQRIDLGELVARERWAVLLGDPGAGKTTLVRWLTLQFARAVQAGAEMVQVAAEQVRADQEEKGEALLTLGPARLPVVLRLADYERARWRDGDDSGLTLFEYLGRQPWLGRALHPDPKTSQALAHHYIHQQQSLILLDGLDEIVDRDHRGRVVDAIHHFIHTWVREPQSGLCAVDKDFAPWQQREEEEPRTSGGNQLLVTSRPIGYYMAPLAATLSHYTVEEMSDGAIRRFCAAWTRAVHEQSGRGDPEKDARRMQAALLEEGGASLRELAANPLLLTILAGLYYTLKGRLPERRIQLYDEAVKAVVRQRHDRWQALGLRDIAFRYAMGYVAARLHANAEHPNSLVDEARVQAWLEDALEEYQGRYTPNLAEQAAALLQSSRDLGGFLLERGDGVYGFIHRTFQEYFAALYLAWNRRTVAQEVCARLDEPVWQVVLVLAVAQTGLHYRHALPGLLQAVMDAPEPAPALLPRNALFLVECLPELEPAAVAQQSVAEAARRLLAAYADQGWPPAEHTQRPEPLRQAIEQAWRRLREQPSARQAATEALTGADPARRLAAAELLLETGWTHPELVAPLLYAARTYAEPVATVREALLRHHRRYPAAFTPALLPLRALLADPAQAAQLWAQPAWRAILQAIYLDPEEGTPTEPAVEHVVFDSALTPLLIQAAHEGWPPSSLSRELAHAATQHVEAGLARDAGWALAVSHEAGWRQLLASKDRGGAASHAIHATLLWTARARGLDRDLDSPRVQDLALARDRSLTRACDRVRDLVLPLYDARAHYRVIACLLDLTSALDSDLNLARAFDIYRVRHLARALANDLDRYLARVQDITFDDTMTNVQAKIGEIGQYIQSTMEGLEHQGAPEEIRAPLARICATLDNLSTFNMPDLQWIMRAAFQFEENTKLLSELSKQRVQGRLVVDAEILARAEELSEDEHAELDLPTNGEQSALADQVRAAALRWRQAGDNPVLCASGALLLAELNQPDHQLLPDLVGLLGHEQDLFRYRARLALNRARAATDWGREGLETLAGYAAREESQAPPLPGAADYLVTDYCAWTLDRVIHDQSQWLADWAQRAMADGPDLGPCRRLLSIIHYLKAVAWPQFLDLLRHSPPEVKVLLLESTGWLLRLKRVPDEQQGSLVELLLTLSREGEPVASAALEALGHLPKPQATFLEALLAWAEEAGPHPQWWSTLARLAPKAKPAWGARVDSVLEAATPAASVDGALAHRILNRQQRFDPTAALAELGRLRPTPAVQLAALLAAGRDDDVWQDESSEGPGYHERVALTIRQLVQQHSDLFPLLVDELRLAPTEENWPRQRIALAALARCAEAMPAQFNQAATDLEPLLLQATQNLHSFSARRFAITALSYLRVVSPEALAALLRLAGDSEPVQRDAIATARRFNRLHPALGEQLPAPLVEALSGPSSARAYMAVLLLEALGASQASQATPGLRRQIVEALAAALQDEKSRRPVWLFTGDDIKEEGVLDQHLYRALLRVSGFSR